MPDRDKKKPDKKDSSSTKASQSPGSPQISQNKFSDSSRFLEINEIQSRLNLINSAVDEYIQENIREPKILYEAAYHLIQAGGKRFRSLIMFLCCEAVGGTAQQILPVTIAAELLQTASLIHDDIIDQDELRRGVQTVHKKYGENIAILAGDVLISEAFRIMGKHGTLELVGNFGRSGVQTCEGEATELLMTPKIVGSFSKDMYFYMVKHKTATFMEESARTGAIVGGASEEQREILAQYGAMIGFAFQLRDDTIDIEASIEQSQKTVLSDLRSLRGNFPLIFALEASSDEERNNCLKALNDGNLDVALRLIKQTEAIKNTMELAQSYVERAKQVLQGKRFQNQDILIQMAEFVVRRGH